MRSSSPLDRSYVANYAARNERKVVAEIAMRQGIEGNQHLKAVTPAFAQLKRSDTRTLRAAQACPLPLAVAVAKRVLGQHLAAPAGPAAGRLETISAYKIVRGGGRALELSGWAERRSGSRRIAREHPSGRWRRHGNRGRALVARRPDVEQAAARSLGPVGWKGVASVPSILACLRATPSFRVESEPVRCSPIAKRSPKALRRPSAAPTGTCRWVAGHQYIASLQPFSALS